MIDQHQPPILVVVDFVCFPDFTRLFGNIVLDIIDQFMRYKNAVPVGYILKQEIKLSRFERINCCQLKAYSAR